MKLLKHKPTLFFFLLITSYVLIYSVTCFINWELLHPFQWALDIPTDDKSDRAFILFISFFYLSTVFRITCLILDPDEELDDFDDFDEEEASKKSVTHDL